MVSTVTLSRMQPERSWHVIGAASGMYFSKKRRVLGFSMKLKDVPVAAMRLRTSILNASWSNDSEPVLIQECLYKVSGRTAEAERARDLLEGTTESERPREVVGE